MMRTREHKMTKLIYIVVITYTVDIVKLTKSSAILTLYSVTGNGECMT
jgi:hypothetical protein